MRFADALLAEGDHYRAIGEYKHFLFLAPDAPEAQAARFRIGLAYLRGGQPSAAEAQFASLGTAGELERGYARYLARDFQGARFQLVQWLGSSNITTADRARAHWLLGWTLLSLGDTAGARETAPALAPAADELDRVPSRSPLAAGLLSIVPGLGHLYLGQPVIAFSALAWNGLFAYGLYDAIHGRQIGLALVLGLFEALWYSGTIFGAVSGAQKFNRDAKANAMDSLHARYDDRPKSWPPAPGG